MAAATFACPSCQATLKRPENLPAGVLPKCPRCGHHVSLPTPAAPPAPAHTQSSLVGEGSIEEATQGATGSHHEDPTPAGDPFTYFLAPPQKPGELGRLGPYRVLEILGHGGMGVVFKAEDPNLRRTIALKVMLPQVASNPTAKSRFLREARAQAAIEHDHVIAIHQVGEDRGIPYLAMPLLKGKTLGAALKASPLPPVGEILRVGREMAEGLAAAHECGLVHRDIKPANVWLEGHKRRVKILDFGLARTATDASPDGSDASASDASGLDQVTRQGAAVGTPAFMSPEQAKGAAVDHRTDLFSLGVVLYQMATGELPFHGRDALSIMMSLAMDTPVPPASKNPNIPPALSAFILKLLAKVPAERSANAEAVAEGLRQIEEAVVRSPATALAAPAGNDPWADIDATDFGEVVHPVSLVGASAVHRTSPRPRVTRPRSPKQRRLEAGIGAAALLLMGVLAWLAVRAAMPAKGTLVLESADPAAEVVVRRDGKEVYRGGAGEVALPAGDGYTVEFAEAKPTLRLTTTRFALAGGRRETVRVEVRARPTPPVTPVPPLTPPAAAGDYALSFDGTAKVEAPFRFPPTGPFTLEGFVTVRSVPEKGAPLVFGAHGHSSVFMSPGGMTFTTHVPRPLRAGLPAVPLNRRVHVAAVRAATELRLFLDGRQVAETPLPASVVTPAGGVGLLGEPGFVGLLDEVRLSKVARYDKDFTPSPRFAPDADTLALYHCDEGQGTVLKDSSGNGLDGLLRGATWEPVAASSPPGAIDLLRLIDAAKDAVKGTWERKGNDLIGEGRGAHAVIEVPYRPAEEYDYLIEFTRQGGESDVSLLLAKGGQSFKLCMDVHGHNFGFDLVDGKTRYSAYPERAFINGRRYRAKVEVRKDRVRAFVDDQPLKELETGGVVLSMYPPTKLRDETLLGLSLPNGPVAFHRMEVVEVTGKGTFTRPQPIDLLPLIDLPKDAVKGAWERKGIELIGKADPLQHAVLEVPYRPGDEYDYIVEFTRTEGNHDVGLAVSHAGRSFKWSLAAWEKRFGFNLIDGRGVSQDPDAVRPEMKLVNGRRYVAKVEVRRDGLAGYLDGKRVSELKTDYSNLSMHGGSRLRDPTLIGLNLYEVSAVFHRVAVVEVTGKGTFTRPAVDPDRRAAEMLNPWCKLHVRLANGKDEWVYRNKPIPAAPFVVVEAIVDGHLAMASYPADYVDTVVLPALLPLKSLETYNTGNWRHSLSETHLARLAAAPFAPNLRTLEGAFSLTPKTLALVKQFPQLTSLNCLANRTDDEALAGLRELPALKRLFLRYRRVIPFGARGYEALASLPLIRLGLGCYGPDAPLDAAALRRFAAMPGLTEFEMGGEGGGGDALLPEVARFPRLEKLNLWENKRVTDAGLVHLYGMTTLRSVFLGGTSVTQEGAQKLADALPRCQVKMTGAKFGPKDKSVVPPPPEPDEPDAAAPDADRQAAELLNSCFYVTVRLDGGKVATIGPGQPIPAGPFAITALNASHAAPKHFPRPRAVLEAAVPLQSLETFHGNVYRFPFAPEDSALLARAAFAPRLTALGGAFDLTPQLVQTLKQYPRLETLLCLAEQLDEATLAGLKELPQLKRLNLRLGDKARLSPGGCETLASLPLTSLGFSGKGSSFTLDVEAMRKFARMPHLTEFALSGARGDEFLPELARFPRLEKLDFFENKGLTDAGLQPLFGMTTLRDVSFAGSSVTAAGARKLSEALPKCRVRAMGATFGPTDKTAPPLPAEPDGPEAAAPDFDRRAAELLHPKAELGLKLGDGKTVKVKPADPLPAGPFALTLAYFADIDPLPADYVQTVLVPAIAELRGPFGIQDNWEKLRFRPEDLERLAASPVAATLTSLEGYFALTPRIFPSLLHFTNLTHLACYGDQTQDELTERLKELRSLSHLGLKRFGRAAGERGWAALSALPLETLELKESAITRDIARQIAAMPGLKKLYLYAADLDDAGLAELAASRSLARLFLTKTQVTDAGLEHLKRMTTLRFVNVWDTNATAAGIQALRAALPNCAIHWNGADEK